MMRRQIRKRYPGACPLEFQNVMDILIKSLLKWDANKQESTGTGIAGDLTGWVQAAEEQGRGTLHTHWQLFTKQLSNKARTNLFHPDKRIRDNTRAELVDYIDSMVCASYGPGLKIPHVCADQHTDHQENANRTAFDETAVAEASQHTQFIPRHMQTFRDARHKVLCEDIDGKLIICTKCKGLIKGDDIVENFYRYKSSTRKVSEKTV